MLSNQPYAAVFGPASTSPYLSGTLEKQGELLVDYDAVAHEELPNEVALISGQGPTRRNRRQLPELHRNRADRHRRRRTGPRRRLRLPEEHGHAPRPARREAADMARLRAGHRRTGHRCGRLRPPRARPARPDLRPEPRQRHLLDVPQPVRLLRVDHRLAVLRRRRRRAVVASRTISPRPRRRRTSPTSSRTAATTETRRPARRAPRPASARAKRS